ncbi:hypothetical protein EVJ58_g3641 [Rhodofomes roseus]|nr:hypothetical protein EVJ58_g3641 [Rhodofomes roseus]
MQGGMMMPFIHANERFRRVRKLVTTELRPAAVSEYFHPIQTAEVHRLVQCITQSPERWSEYLSRAVGSILMTAVYDKPLRSGQDTEGAIKNVIKLNDDLINAIDGGQNYVDFLPFLQYIPNVPYKALASKYYNLAETTYRGLMEDARRNLQAGLPARGIAARLLQYQHETEADYREQYWALGSFYLAGSDTQSIMAHSLIMALALHPRVLARAQAEVDAVVGDERCPTFEDETRLPYLRATICEVLRWRPSGPTAIPHAVIDDDEYGGYFIPGGSMVIPNIWSMHMDERVFKDPAMFEPERYLNNPSLPLHAFGFGRRSCPGRRVGEHTLFLMLATIVWALDVRPKLDSSTGRPIPINSDRETGFASVGLLRARPFAVALTPRSEERSRLLAQIVEDGGL